MTATPQFTLDQLILELVKHAPAAVICIDLDPRGELALAYKPAFEHAQRLQAQRRVESVLRLEGTTALWSYDERKIVLALHSKGLDIQNVSRAIYDELCRPYAFSIPDAQDSKLVGAQSIAQRPSVGVYLPTPGVNEPDPNFFIRRAQLAAMQRPSELSYFDPKLEAQVVEQVNMRSLLEAQRQQHWPDISLFYMPLCNVVDEKAVFYGAEALARLTHPQTGKLVFPDHFIPRLEEDSRAMYEFGLHFLTTAFTQAQRWQSDYDRQFPLSVNVSPVQLTANIVSDFADSIPAQWRPHIKLEITEGRQLNQGDYAVINELQRAGFPIWLDDAGSKCMNLDTLLHVKPDGIKVDMSFIRQSRPTEPDCRYKALAMGLITIARSLNIPVVIEGIENGEQMRFYGEHGVLQGYHLGKPMPAADLAQRYLIPQ